MSSTEQAATPHNPSEQHLDSAAPVTRLDHNVITTDDDIVEYWETAAQDLDWDTPWTTALDWSDAPEPAGSMVVPSTPPPTASTATSTPAAETSSPITGSAKTPTTPATSPTVNSSTTCAKPPTT